MSERLHMPPLAGAAGWLNSEPLGPAELRGHVVLVNFWTLTCINWLRQEPYVRAWSQAYRDDGLIVIGVHTPEFSFEHEIGNVRSAIERQAIDYPVVIDNDFATWNAFANQYWPALYFVDADGIIQDQHFGEERYEQSERVIQQLLGIKREPASVEVAGVEAGADWDHLGTPETYVGYARGERFASRRDAKLDRPNGYEQPARLHLNDWALTGEWTIGREKLTLDRAPGAITYRYHARDAHVVLSAGPHGQIPFRVRLDGAPPGRSHGEDIDESGNGVLDEARLYQLVRAYDRVRERTLEIIFLERGAEAYSLTFG